jgi:hypothetical protein
LKIHFAERFQELFTLQPNELKSFQSNVVDDAFFAALDHVHEISNRAKLLVKVTNKEDTIILCVCVLLIFCSSVRQRKEWD